MKTLYKIIFFVLMVYWASSCEYNVTGLDNPEFEKQMVVHCFLSHNQSKIVALVSYNSEIYGQFNQSKINKHDLSGVKAYLSDGTNEAAFYEKNDSFFIDASLFPILEGHKYALRVRDDNTGLEVNAQCEVPTLKNCEVTVDTSFSKWEYGGAYFSNLLNFKTTLNTSNMPNTYIKVKSYCTVYWRSKRDSSSQYSYKYPLDNKDCFIKPGMKTFQYEVACYGFNFDSIDSAFYDISVFEYDYEYYTYKKSLNNYSDEQSFMTEISPVYTNINGGLGFFGGFTMQEFKMKLNKDMVENK